MKLLINIGMLDALQVANLSQHRRREPIIMTGVGLSNVYFTNYVLKYKNLVYFALVNN